MSRVDGALIPAECHDPTLVKISRISRGKGSFRLKIATTNIGFSLVEKGNVED